MAKHLLRPYDDLIMELRNALSDGRDQFGFNFGHKDYMVMAEYDESPLVKGWLFVAEDDTEPDLWTVIAETGEEYSGDEPPEPWRGLPEFLAEKLAAVARLNDIANEEDE